MVKIGWKLIKENENPKVDILVIEKGITFLVESEFVWSTINHISIDLLIYIFLYLNTFMLSAAKLESSPEKMYHNRLYLFS